MLRRMLILSRGPEPAAADARLRSRTCELALAHRRALVRRTREELLRA